VTARLPELLGALLGPLPGVFSDLHVIRLFSAYAAISESRVVRVTEPRLAYCPLAQAFYGRQYAFSPDAAQETLKTIIEDKIRQFGHYTERREILCPTVEVPFGASEIMMAGLRTGRVDAAVVVCDGAGTVVTARPGIVQGIGARMNALFYTTPIPGLVRRLEAEGGRVPFADAAINQLEGAAWAGRQGLRRLAVTVNAAGGESLAAIREMARSEGLALTILAVCTTGISAERVAEVAAHADLVWSCASTEIREAAGHRAILQVSLRIPVFVMTPQGLDLVQGYAADGPDLGRLDPAKQYLAAMQAEGAPLRMAGMDFRLQERPLPVRSPKEPRWQEPGASS